VRRKQRRVRKDKTSLGGFARRTNPLDEPKGLLKRLKLESSESKFLEWKITPPFGAGVTKKLKYGMVRTLISFANTYGGFMVFGINPNGEWVGFSRQELSDTDPAKIAEIVNECVTPELGGLNYGVLRYKSRFFPVIHVPPSALMPHVTTKEIIEKHPNATITVYLRKHAVYCRYPGKTDLATAAQYSRIIRERTQMLRSEMLRRVKEVKLPSLTPGTFGTPPVRPIIRVSNIAGDKSVPAVRITRDPREASGVILQEELSAGLFEEINHVLDANRLLARGNRAFVFGDDIYYRIYAERQHVDPQEETYELLARTALGRVYGPFLFWIIKLPARTVAKLIDEVLANPRSSYIHLICRLAILLGPQMTQWLLNRLHQEWRNHPQPPEHYFTFKRMAEAVGNVDVRLIAIQQSARSKIDLSGINSGEISVRELLADTSRCLNLLSKSCMAVFEGNRSQRATSRQLDVLGYGSDILESGKAISAAFRASKPS